MPTLDPGYAAYLQRQAIKIDVTTPDIEPTEHGWVWTVNGERHELFVPFKTVHVFVT